MRYSYYNVIAKNLANYLPSKILIILNSLLIIPVLLSNLSPKEVSIWFIVIQIMNLICTWSFDWTSKAVLRFYEKYDNSRQLNKFISTIFWLSVFLYLIIIILYFCFKDFILEKYSIPDNIFLSTLILIIPCGIRQTIYQILRIKNKYKLYTFSIILYYISFVLLFLTAVKFTSTALAPVAAMTAAVAIIDIIMIKQATLDYKIEFVFDKKILKEVLIYSFPLVFTNTGYWYVFHISKLIFQNFQEYQNTAIIGIAWTLTNCVMQPLVSLFTFVTFPVVFKKFELNRKIQGYLTKNIQVYTVLLLPIVFALCCFSGEVTKMVVPESYSYVAVLIPFFSTTIFLHEFLKISNIKYHLKNITYIETLISFIIVVLTFQLNMFFINKYSLLGAGIAMLLSEILLIVLNFFSKSETFYGIKYKSVIKTICFTIIISGLCAFLISMIIKNPTDMSSIIIKLTAYIILTYLVMFKLNTKILS